MSEIASKAALAAFTREQVADYDEWDSPHALMTLHNVDGELKVGMYCMITPDFPPQQYPRAIKGMVLDFLKRQDEDTSDDKLPPPCAYLLQIEAHMAVLPKDATEADRKRLQADGDSRQIHARPDAVEIANAVTVDVHGRVFSAIRRRDTGEVVENFHGPADKHYSTRGRFADALLAVAYMTGMAKWDLPGPIPMSN